MKVTIKTKRTGPTYEQINEAVVQQFAVGVLEDHRQTPDQFAGTGRHGRTPFNRTGVLVGGFFFKPASRTGTRTGLVGTIRAPASRFATVEIRDRFRARLHAVWTARGLGWSKAGI